MLLEMQQMLSLIDIQSERSKQFVRGGSTMKKKFLGMLTLLFFVVLTTAAFAQSSAPGDQENRPGQGYGAGPGMMGSQGQGQGQQGTYGPGMMYGQGQGQQSQGPGNYGPSMMYGYGVGWMGGYGGIWVAIVLVILGAGLVAWIVKQRTQVKGP
jgi:uncharacterized membrane protein